MNTRLNDTKLSPHFKLREFLLPDKYPQNIPTMQDVVNLTYGCLWLLEPARLIVGPIIINSGFRNEDVNRKVGGVRNSQHLLGQAADIHTVKDTPAENKKLFQLIQKLKLPYDQLIDEYGYNWIHISYGPRNRRRILHLP